MTGPQADRHLSLVSYVEHAEDPTVTGKRAVTRHRLMNACASIIVESGFRAVSMTAIAERAGIARQTVYRYFADSEEAIAATLMRAGREVQEAQCLVYEEEGDPRDLIVEAVMTALRLITHNVLLVKALASDGNPKSLFLATMDPRVSRRSVEALRKIGDRVGWDEQERRDVNEVLVRCINSFLMMPVKDQSESNIRANLHKRLIPALGL